MAATPLNREQIRKALGDVDETIVTEIIRLRVTAEHLAEARAWVANDEPLLNSGKPLPGAPVSQLVDILAALEEQGEDDPGNASPPAPGSGPV